MSASSSSSKTIRIRCSCGLWRYDVRDDDSVASLAERVRADLASKAGIAASRVHVFASDAAAKAGPEQALAGEQTLGALVVERGQIFFATFELSDGASVKVVTSQLSSSSSRRNKVPRKVTNCPNHGPADTCMSCVIANRVNVKNLTRDSALMPSKSAVGFAGKCADFFAVYPHMLAYQVNRLGILYGQYEATVDGDATKYTARVEFIYEPPQHTTDAGHARLLPDSEATRAELAHVQTIADLWSLYPVGLFVSRRAFDPDHPVTAGEMMLLGRLWPAGAPHPMCLAVTSPSVEGPPLIQAFEIGRQMLELYAWQLWEPPADPDGHTLRANEEVFIGNHYSQDVDAGFFVLPTAIYRCPDSIFRCAFLVENRNEPQLRKEIVRTLTRAAPSQKTAALRDFHLLLFLLTIDEQLAADVLIAVVTNDLSDELIATIKATIN